MKKKIKLTEDQNRMISVAKEIKDDLTTYNEYCDNVSTKIDDFFNRLTKITIREILEGVDIGEELDVIEKTMDDIDNRVDNDCDSIIRKIETLPEDVYYSWGEDIQRECEKLKSDVWNKIKSLERILGKVDNFSKKMVLLYHRDGLKNYLNLGSDEVEI